MMSGFTRAKDKNREIWTIRRLSSSYVIGLLFAIVYFERNFLWKFPLPCSLWRHASLPFSFLSNYFVVELSSKLTCYTLVISLLSRIGLPHMYQRSPVLDHQPQPSLEFHIYTYMFTLDMFSGIQTSTFLKPNSTWPALPHLILIQVRLSPCTQSCKLEILQYSIFSLFLYVIILLIYGCKSYILLHLFDFLWQKPAFHSFPVISKRWWSFCHNPVFLCSHLLLPIFVSLNSFVFNLRAHILCVQIFLLFLKLTWFYGVIFFLPSHWSFSCKLQYAFILASDFLVLRSFLSGMLCASQEQCCCWIWILEYFTEVLHDNIYYYNSNQYLLIVFFMELIFNWEER